MMRASAWGVAAGLAYVLSIGGCEAVLGVGSLTERGSNDGGADSTAGDGMADGDTDAGSLEGFDGGRDGETSCMQCPVPQNTMGAACSAQGACGYTGCAAGYTDCDGDATNGCEANLSDSGSNCGTCTHSCLGGQCSGGACQPLVLATVPDPFDIVVDSNNVYFTYGSNGRQLGAVAKASGATVRTANAPSTIFTISTNGGNVFGRGAAGDVWVIQGAAINGQDVSVQLTDTAGDTSNFSLIAAGPNITTWIDSADDELKYNHINLGVGAPVQLYKSTGAITFLAVAPDGFLAWADAGMQNVIGGNPASSGTTWSLTPATIGLAAAGVTSIAVDANYVYAAVGGNVSANTRAGAGAGACDFNGATFVIDIAPDGANVYALETAPTKQIYKNGGPPLWGGVPTVVWGDSAIEHLAADATALYWTDSTGQVLMLAK